MRNGTTFYTRCRNHSVPTRRLAVACVSLAALVSFTASTPVTAAATTRTPASGSCASCLGTPTNDGTPWFAPLDGFRRVPVPFHLAKLPEIVLVTIDHDANTALMAWPLVKALDGLGSFATLTPAPQQCGLPLPNGQSYCDLPAFDLAGAVFRSRYIAFSYHSVMDRDLHPHMDTLTPAERRFFNRYVRPKGYRSDSSHALWTAESLDRTPAVSIGQYLGLGTKVMIRGDMEQVQYQGLQVTGESGLPFLVVQTALADEDRLSALPRSTTSRSRQTC